MKPCSISPFNLKNILDRFTHDYLDKKELIYIYRTFRFQLEVTWISHPTIEAKISLPVNLLEATYRAVNQGKAKSRDEFIMRAISRELATLKPA